MTDLEQQLRAMYQLGYHAALQNQKVQVITPVCPLHFAPLWTETEPKPDGSWLYCIFCRQNQMQKETENVPIQNVPGMHRMRLVSPKDDWLTSSGNTEEMTVILPVVGIEETERKAS